jgi:hypothetical protein
MGGFRPSRADIAGSTTVGSDKDIDVHQFTGSVDITGSLTLNGSAITSVAGDGTPGGANTQVQFNNSGEFGGSSNFTFDGNTISVSANADVAATIGRAKIGHDGTNNDVAIFAHLDQATQTNYALEQRADGTTNLNAPANGNLSLRINDNNALVVAGASNSNIGINTGTPLARLHVSASSVENDVLRVDGTGAALHALYVSGSGRVGIGTPAPIATTTISSSNSEGQLMLTYDGTKDKAARFTVNSDGDLTLSGSRDIILDPAGGDVFFERAGNRVRVEMSTGTAFFQNEVDNGNLGFKINTENGSIVEMARFEAAGDGSLLMNGSVPVQFRDATTAISSPAASRLTVIAPTLDVTGTLAVNGVISSSVGLSGSTLTYGGTSVTTTANELNLLDPDSTPAISSSNWYAVERVARTSIGSGQYAIGNHILGGITLPENAIVTDCVIDIKTGFNDGGNGDAEIALAFGSSTPVTIRSAATLAATGFNSAGIRRASLMYSFLGGKTDSDNAPLGFTVDSRALTAGAADVYVYYLSGSS